MVQKNFDRREFDVAVVGAGAAGITAAASLAKKGYSVAVIEKGMYPGAENWSGTVYFTENLVADDVFGPELLENAPFERNLVKRGFLLYDGISMAGGEYKNAQTFQNCHTVLRPVFDRYLAEKASEFGATIISETTVQSLIREQGKVIGCHTDRGPVFASCVFLAEGDASHLTSQEGYENLSEKQKQDGAPHFLQGIKEVIELPQHVIEDRFDLSRGEGAAFEILLRNGNVQHSTTRLNAGGFLYTNRNSVSLGLVLPVDNLKENPVGDHNYLMEWFKGLPKIRRLIEDGELQSFGTKIIRGGGYNEIPQMVDDGLAIGGAATGIGLDFPYPNFTGPATFMGRQFAQAFDEIHSSGSSIDQRSLKDSYENPVRVSHYFQDVEYLAEFPDYVERTQFFFENQIDLIAGSGYFWFDPEKGFFDAITSWMRYLQTNFSRDDWKKIRSESAQLSRIFGFGSHFLRNLGLTTVFCFFANTIWSLLPVSQSLEEDAGELSLYFDTRDEPSDNLETPFLLQWLAHRFEEPLKKALNSIYTNDRSPLENKLSNAVNAMMKGVSPWDFLLATILLPSLALLYLCQRASDVIQVHLLGNRTETLHKKEKQYIQKRENTLSFESEDLSIEDSKDRKLSSISYFNSEDPFIRVFYPEDIQKRKSLEKSPLWHVCPARVYEIYPQRFGNPGITVNFENCIKCETCWRATEDVHWSIQNDHRMIFEAYSPSQKKLSGYLENRTPPTPKLPPSDTSETDQLRKQCDVMEEVFLDLPAEEQEVTGEELRTLQLRFLRLKNRIQLFIRATDQQPTVIEKGRNYWLNTISESILDLSENIDVLLKSQTFLPFRKKLDIECSHHLYDRWNHTHEKIQQLQEYGEQKRAHWAAETGRRILDYQLPRLKSVFLNVLQEDSSDHPEINDEIKRLREDPSENHSVFRRNVRDTLDETFDHKAIKSLENGQDLTSSQLTVLQELISDLSLSRNNTQTKKPRVLVEEAARIDPSIAWIIAQHLHGIRLLLALETERKTITFPWRKYYSGERWLTVVSQGKKGEQFQIEREGEKSGSVEGTAEFVPLQLADDLLVFDGEKAVLIERDETSLDTTRANPCGLIGGNIHRIHFQGEEGTLFESSGETETFAPFKHRIPQLARAGDLFLSLCKGASEYLLDRSKEHARSRVQFPGQFQDEAGMDTIGKFGAVKQMISEMETGHQQLKTLANHAANELFPEHPELFPVVQHVIGGNVLGPEPGSCGYNAGQVFGGTAYSEDDFISKFYRDSSVTRFLLTHPGWSQQYLGLTLLRDAERNGQSFTENQQITEFLNRFSSESIWNNYLSCFDRSRDELEEIIQELHEELGAIRSDQQQLIDGHGTKLRRLGEAFAQYISVRGIIIDTLQKFNRGQNVEWEILLCEHASDLLLQNLDRTKRLLKLDTATQNLGKRILEKGAFQSIPELQKCPDYESFLESDFEKQSGKFLLDGYRTDKPRYIPEMRSNDPVMGEEEQSITKKISARYGDDLEQYPDGSFEGLSYGRYLEKLHQFPDEDLEYLQQEGLFRYPITTKHGGEGHSKAGYLMMTNILMRYGDPSMALVVMGNTSIGTTPIQLGLKQDLPSVRRELNNVQEDSSYISDIRESIGQICSLVEKGNLDQANAEYQNCKSLVKDRIHKTKALKYLSGAFLGAFREAGRAGQNMEAEQFLDQLENARSALSDIQVGIEEKLREYDIREEAHKFALKQISAGGVSAFALTEPTAGSDSGGIKTKATLKRRSVYEDDETGFHYFLLNSEDEDSRRYILDSRRIEFDAEQLSWLYRTSGDGTTAEIKFDEYDYQLDRPEGKKRYLDLDDRKQYFHDIGRIRTDEEGNKTFEYFELNGSKMWITNGRMASLFCLYAQTEEGVTGFVVDRHVEGLVVGADEEKMGQRGSPTNELSLKSVRVPRENVIGFRGRGQVNALETLNSGRTGLSYCSVGQMRDIVQRDRFYCDQRSLNEEQLPSLNHQFGEIASYIVATEALAHEVVGFLDHPETRGIRMESAIGKYAATENYHQAITCSERLKGIEGQTGFHEIEKKRRDARVLNIYEGTNEVQRFLILKDLFGRIYPELQNRQDSVDSSESSYPELAKHLENDRNQLLKFLENVGETFGQRAWQQVSYQPVFFPLSEMTGALKQMESTLYRMDKLNEISNSGKSEYGSLVKEAGEQFIRREHARFQERSETFRRRYEYLLENRYPPSVQIGFFSLSENERTTSVEATTSGRSVEVQNSLTIAVGMKPVPYSAPSPRISDGDFVESLYRINPSDRTALEEALAIKRHARSTSDSEDSEGVVQVEVFCIGSENNERVQNALRQALALGADRATQIITPAEENLIPQHEARAYHRAITSGDPDPDLILLGDQSEDTGQDTTASLLASQLEWDHHDKVVSIPELSATRDQLNWNITSEAWADSSFETSGKLVLSMENQSSESSSPSYTIQSFLESRDAEIREIHVSPGSPSVKLQYNPRTVLSSDETEETVTDPEGAAKHFLEKTGGGSQTDQGKNPYSEEIVDATSSEFELNQKGIFLMPPVTNPDANLSSELLDIGKHAGALARTRNEELCMLLPSSLEEETLRKCIAPLIESTDPELLITNHPNLHQFSWKGYEALLLNVQKQFEGTPSFWMGPESYKNCLSRIAPRFSGMQNTEDGVLLWSNVESIARNNGSLEAITPVMEGKINASVQFPRQLPFVLITRDDFTVSDTDGKPASRETAEVYRYTPDLSYSPQEDRFASFLNEVHGEKQKQSLQNANYIIDVGYGVGDMEGMKRLTEPLKELLEDDLGLEDVMVGATRKVTQDLELLPHKHQIGQTGVPVNPEVIFALGVSGAPQHVDYIGENATIYSFNIDPDAPLMNLNEQQPVPVVHPIEGDMFETIPAFLEHMRTHAELKTTRQES